MRFISIPVLVVFFLNLKAQPAIDISGVRKNGAIISVRQNSLSVQWPAGKGRTAKIVLNMDDAFPLFSTIGVTDGRKFTEVIKDLDPVFIVREGVRTLAKDRGGWDVFFDKVPTRPYATHVLEYKKGNAEVTTKGTRTIIRIGAAAAGSFKGHLELVLYNGTPLFNVAAVIATHKDSTALLYDAGLINKGTSWKNIAWSDVKGVVQTNEADATTASRDLEVKYRTVIGEGSTGSLAVFPAPHQYFYPLDEAFNLKFAWAGSNYLNKVKEFGIGIRQDPAGDKRFVPWFNAPPGTNQRLNFFCLIDDRAPASALEEVKCFTNGDAFAKLPGYKTMATHFHNEFITNVVMSGKPVPEDPEFVSVLKKAGLDIVKLAEFHGVGHPRGPDSIRLAELQAMFEQTERLSGPEFLLLPGEEANNFYGGHWLAFFPKPVYWVMSRTENEPFVKAHALYGKVYHVGNKEEMLRLLELEKGLAWVAHARTKGSTGYPDKYRDEAFFKSDTYLGAAWKSIPADLSWNTLSKRVLHLMDDMANWGLKKYGLAESDIFTITEQNEMYAHLNVNYLKMDTLPAYRNGWHKVLDVLRKGRFFVSTGEVLIPSFRVGGRSSGEILQVPSSGKVKVAVDLKWTFPMNHVEIVSGDGKNVFRELIPLDHTLPFGKQSFQWETDLAGKKWVRLEAWDIAANGAFTQQVWLQ